MSAYEAILESLKALARARQVPEFGKETQRAYLGVLQGCDPQDVRTACLQLAGEPRADYAPPMPEAGLIRTRANEISKQRYEDNRRLLTAGVPPEPSPEKTAEFLAKLRQLAGRRGMA